MCTVVKKHCSGQISACTHGPWHGSLQGDVSASIDSVATHTTAVFQSDRSDIFVAAENFVLDITTQQSNGIVIALVIVLGLVGQDCGKPESYSNSNIMVLVRK